ncbi:hypothetical protein LJC56_08065 [Christensenellaceae bacterium OttesenSCG-928-K19]|nr:hypothetical protein [Christensenellaceae bacterium OttesenSCG-928-K19]
MGKKESIGIGTGSVSILAIFVVLCLTTLSALSLVSARADYVLAEKTAQVSKEYYEADAAAEAKLADLLEVVKTGGYQWEGYAMEQGFEIFLRDGTTVVAYTVPINDKKELYAEIELVVDAEGQATGEWNRTVWQTRITGEYIIDESMNVF